MDLNPKAVTIDGLFAVIMRDIANITGDRPKWIVLDGDIDPVWAEGRKKQKKHYRFISTVSQLFRSDSMTSIIRAFNLSKAMRVNLLHRHQTAPVEMYPSNHKLVLVETK